MNAVALSLAAPLDAWFQAMRCWLLSLLASFVDALERARCPQPDDRSWRVRLRVAVRAILCGMRASVAAAEREIARALLMSALTRVIGRRRHSNASRPSVISLDHASPRHRVAGRLLKPVLREWRRARGQAAVRLGARVCRLAATLADPERAIKRIAQRLVALRREPTWRVRPASHGVQVALAQPAPSRADTS